MVQPDVIMEPSMQFLRDLSRDSLYSKTEILILAAYLGVEKLVPTINTITEQFPNNLIGAARTFLMNWNDQDLDPPQAKLQKLRRAYQHLDKGGIFQRGIVKIISSSL